MPSTRVLVVSDSHLSARTPEATANWDAVVAHAAAGAFDLVVHVGDITADGAGVHADADLALARAELSRLGSRLRVVPGNHDIGDNPTEGGEPGGDYERPVTPARIERFRAALGPDRWVLDVPGWRVVGLDSLLFGSGLPAEDEQWRWLADTLADADAGTDPGAADRRLALVLHKPLAPPPPSTDAAPHRYLPPAAARRLTALAPPGRLALAVSGHVHQHTHHERDGLAHLWAPTTWAVLPDRIQTRLGAKTCGVVELDLHPDGRHDARLVEPVGLAQNVLIDTVPDPYGL